MENVLKPTARDAIYHTPLLFFEDPLLYEGSLTEGSR